MEATPTAVEQAGWWHLGSLTVSKCTLFTYPAPPGSGTGRLRDVGSLRLSHGFGALSHLIETLHPTDCGRPS
ncbi:hypothetical protein J7T55_001554 [Diaporthe amygdali]|uniref:uncharacterized protein n=1 Tax=Phomopsis amygdali TaxID=1214568 RepID=UPI0022FDC368|nr:uncharacterized protein J7T55_001554 [Diaporthe amygdali]KAJ0115145.1 hypothetical protein J7T55_001554 [Diaporthe amygdali]